MVSNLDPHAFSMYEFASTIAVEDLVDGVHILVFYCPIDVGFSVASGFRTALASLDHLL